MANKGKQAQDEAQQANPENLPHRQDGGLDLRTKAAREIALEDSTQKKDGSPDMRLEENRPDLQEYNANKDGGEANVKEEFRSHNQEQQNP